MESQIIDQELNDFDHGFIQQEFPRKTPNIALGKGALMHLIQQQDAQQTLDNKPKKARKPRAPALSEKWKKFNMFTFGVLEASGLPMQEIHRILRSLKVTESVDNQNEFFEQWFEDVHLKALAERYKITVMYLNSVQQPHLVEETDNLLQAQLMPIGHFAASSSQQIR